MDVSHILLMVQDLFTKSASEETTNRSKLALPTSRSFLRPDAFHTPTTLVFQFLRFMTLLLLSRSLPACSLGLEHAFTNALHGYLVFIIQVMAAHKSGAALPGCPKLVQLPLSYPLRTICISFKVSITFLINLQLVV